MEEKGKNLKGAKASWRYFWLWLSTLLVFWAILFIVRFDFLKNSSGTWLILFFLNILLGIVFFLRFLSSFFRSLKDKNKKEPLKYGFATLSLIVLFLTSFYTASPIAKAYFSLSNSGARGEQTTNESVESANFAQSTETSNNETQKPPTNNNINVNTIECIGPDGKHFQTTLEECTALNEEWGKPVDYMTNCDIHPDCGGGTIRMSYSQCMKPCSGLVVETNEPASFDNSQPVVVAPTTSVQNSSPRVVFKATETVITGTYYCYEDKVNQLVTKQALTKTYRELKELCYDREDLKKQAHECYIAECGTGSWIGCDTQGCFRSIYTECINLEKTYINYRSELENMRWEYCP